MRDTGAFGLPAINSTPAERALARYVGAGGSRELLTEAARNRRTGAVLPRDQASALRRYERYQAEELQRDHLRAIPQRLFRELAGGVQTKQLQDWAAKWSAPVARPVIDGAELLVWLRQHLADLGRRPIAGEDEDPLLSGASSPALEEYRRWRAALARLEYQERERQLLPRDQVHAALGRLAAILRQAGETLQRQFGTEAYDILDEALVDAEREIEGVGNADDGTPA